MDPACTTSCRGLSKRSTSFRQSECGHLRSASVPMPRKTKPNQPPTSGTCSTDPAGSNEKQKSRSFSPAIRTWSRSTRPCTIVFAAPKITCTATPIPRPPCERRRNPCSTKQPTGQPIDALLTTGRSGVEGAARAGLQRVLDRYKTGVEVLQVRLLDVHPSARSRQRIPRCGGRERREEPRHE